MDGMMEQERDYLTDSPEEAYEYAGFWIRFAASLLDSIVIFGVYFLGGMLFGTDREEPPGAFVILSIVLPYAYYVIMTTVYGQTLGKMAVGIKVVMQSGGPNHWGWIFLREVIGKWISGIILFIGYIMAGFDSKKRALHDRIGSTYVVKVK
jgi:uncharacterized RDD family membrane protein YckC